MERRRILGTGHFRCELELDWHKYVDTDPRFFRPTEVDILRGDPGKARYFFPIQLLHVSPTIARTPFTLEAVQATSSELAWIWIPCLLITGVFSLKPRALSAKV